MAHLLVFDGYWAQGQWWSHNIYVPIVHDILSTQDFMKLVAKDRVK